MKKVFSLLLIMCIILVNCSCSKTKEKENEDIIYPVTSEESNKPIEPEYIDNNSITIGLYTRDSKGYHYIDNDIYLPWNQYIDIAVFKVLATHDATINSWYMQDAFPTYWNYENNKNYKIGFNLSYSTDNGDFSWNIINPNDRMYDVFNFVQMYVYDDVSPTKGAWYDHLDDNEVTENVVFTSIKLCASTYINSIHSPMKLTVFTYDESTDFDPKTGLYRGNSSHTINIYKTN